MTPMQATLAEIWAEILPSRDFGIDDDFIELGGDSLLGKSIMVRVCRRFGINLPNSVIFRARTIRGLSEHIERALKSSVPSRADS